MTVLELINALENARGDYDDPVELVRPIWRQVERFEILKLSIAAEKMAIGPCSYFYRVNREERVR